MERNKEQEPGAGTAMHGASGKKIGASCKNKLFLALYKNFPNRTFFLKM